MRLLICLLLLFVLGAPAYADDDWDGDQVIHKRASKDKDAEAKGNSAGDKEAAREAVRQAKAEKKKAKGKKGEPSEQPPIGMYFGNGDEYLESGAPNEPAATDASGQTDPYASPETPAAAQPEASFSATGSDDGEHRSAILGPRHKAPDFANPYAKPDESAAASPAADATPAEESATPAADSDVDSLKDEFAPDPADTTADADKAEPATPADSAGVPETPTAEAPDADPAADPDSAEPASNDAAPAEGSAPAEVDTDPAAEQPAEAAPAGESTAEPADDSTDLHEDSTLTPSAGLDHYSTYPQIQGKGKSKKVAKQSAKPKAKPGEDESKGDDSPESSDDSAKPKHKGGINMYDPDKW